MSAQTVMRATGASVSDREDDEGDRRTTGAETRPDDRREDGGSTHREGDRAFVIERESRATEPLSMFGARGVADAERWGKGSSAARQCYLSPTSVAHANHLNTDGGMGTFLLQGACSECRTESTDFPDTTGGMGTFSLQKLGIHFCRTMALLSQF
jgi:hypothetical protein